MKKQIRIGSKVKVITSPNLEDYPNVGDILRVRDTEGPISHRNIWLVDYPMNVYLFDGEVELVRGKKKLWTK